MFKWFRPAAIDPLSVSMAGAKLGDRVLVIGCGDPQLIAALGAKVGLSGRTCAVDDSSDRATEAGRIALKEGVLVETSAATLDTLTFADRSFDVVVVRGTSGVTGAARVPVFQEALRVLRPGGRCVVIDTIARAGGIAALLGAQSRATPTEDDGTVDTLKGLGFVAVRVLAEREGVRFIEAVKKND
jgi:ubiquinone/menaquinone biosynthesis C-methylase UbiE